MVDQAKQRDYDGLVLLGDLIYPEGDADQARSRITDVFEPILSRGARLVAVLGNHDYLSDEQSAILPAVRPRSAPPGVRTSPKSAPRPSTTSTSSQRTTA